MTLSRSLLFKAAWSMARRAAEASGRPVREEFGTALRDVWAASREVRLMPKDGPAMILCLLEIGVLGLRQKAEYPNIAAMNSPMPAKSLGRVSGPCAIRRTAPKPFYLANA